MGKIIRFCIMLIALMFVSCTVTKSWADVIPGSAYNDFTTPVVSSPNTSKFGVRGKIMAFDCIAHPTGCTNNNPPTLKTLFIDDLQNAIKAEVYVSFWGGHYGTTEERLRINSTKPLDADDWLPLPRPVSTPTQNLTYDRAIYYHRTLLSTVPIVIPVTSLKKGINSIQFWATGQEAWGYPNYWVYSFTVRVYYDGTRRTYPSGSISVISGNIIDENQVISAIVGKTYPGGIKQVDFIGYYKDFNWEGDGCFQNWHYIYSNGNLSKHIGTATSSPYSVTWNTGWIPDQDPDVPI